MGPHSRMGWPGGPRTHLARLCLISAVVAVVVGMLAGTALAASSLAFDSVATPSAAGAGSFSAGSGTTGTLSVAGAGNSNSTPTETLTYSFGSPQDLSGLQQIEVQYSQTSASDQTATFPALITVTDSQGNTSTDQ